MKNRNGSNQYSERRDYCVNTAEADNDNEDWRTKANHLIWFQPFTLQCCCVATFRNCFVLEKLSLHSKFRPSDFSNNYIGN